MTQKEAIRRASLVARRVFEKRGNHSEAHLSETELIAIIVYSLRLNEIAAKGMTL